MSELELAFMMIGAGVAIIAVIVPWSNRITRLEEKMDIFLEYIICEDEEKGTKNKQQAYKKALIRKKATAALNGNVICGDSDC